MGCTIYKTTFSLTALALPQAPKHEESQPAREGEWGRGGWQQGESCNCDCWNALLTLAAEYSKHTHAPVQGISIDFFFCKCSSEKLQINPVLSDTSASWPPITHSPHPLPRHTWCRSSDPLRRPVGPGLPHQQYGHLPAMAKSRQKLDFHSSVCRFASPAGPVPRFSGQGGRGRACTGPRACPALPAPVCRALGAPHPANFKAKGKTIT